MQPLRPRGGVRRVYRVTVCPPPSLSSPGYQRILLARRKDFSRELVHSCMQPQGRKEDIEGVKYAFYSFIFRLSVRCLKRSSDGADLKYDLKRSNCVLPSAYKGISKLSLIMARGSWHLAMLPSRSLFFSLSRVGVMQGWLLE